MRPSNSLNLETALRQQLKLTPEMRLRLEVLQATHLELRDILNKELEENPLLEDVIEEEESKLTTEAAQPEQREITESVEFGENKSHLDELPEDDLSNLHEYESYERGPNTHEYNPEIGKLADYRYNSVTDDRDKDLHSQLMLQLNSLSLDDEMHIAVYTLIANLDENGFLPYDMADISEKSGIKPEKLQSALEILQKFEPTGVAARDTSESLLIQLKEKKMKDSLAYLIVESQLELISRQQYEKLAVIFGTSQENVKKAEKVIKSLSPYPGKNYSNENKEYIVPDIIVDEDEDGEYSVRIQGEFPELKVNTKFLNEYKKIKETKAFVKRYEDRIKTLMMSWEERNKTIKNVVKKILEIQSEYLKNEETGLKPLTLKEVADEVGMHESTISRIVSRKYIQMPTGVFPLNRFFSSKLSSTGGDVSSDSVKERIRVMIDGEEQSKPLTDTDIEEKLNDEGVKIARRTVTKYREAMDILPANSRKK